MKFKISRSVSPDTARNMVTSGWRLAERIDYCGLFPGDNQEKIISDRRAEGSWEVFFESRDTQEVINFSRREPKPYLVYGWMDDLPGNAVLTLTLMTLSVYDEMGVRIGAFWQNVPLVRDTRGPASTGLERLVQKYSSSLPFSLDDYFQSEELPNSPEPKPKPKPKPVPFQDSFKKLDRKIRFGDQKS